VTRHRIATFGERGDLVRLFEVSGPRGRYVVQWGAGREQRSFPRTKAGKVEAEQYFNTFRAEVTATRRGTKRLTTRALWEAFRAENFPALRPNSQRIYGEAWGRWEKFYGTTTPAEDLEVVQCGAFRRDLEGRGLAVSTVREAIKNVRIVYNWAERAELIAVNKWHRYVFKVPTGQAPRPRAEYRAEEFVRIWRELDPTLRGQWRAWCIIGLLGIYGNRQHAVLAMEWDWDCGEEIVIPSAIEKTGKEAVLPVFPLTRRILEVARGWRERDGYTGTRVFYGASRKSRLASYSIQSLTEALHEAERRAGITPIKYRAGHGFRRMLVGDLADATGDVGLALQAIGDSLAMAKHYRVRRDDRIRSALSDRLSRMVPEATPEPATESATNGDSGAFTTTREDAN
jgi:integrase